MPTHPDLPALGPLLKALAEEIAVARGGDQPDLDRIRGLHRRARTIPSDSLVRPLVLRSGEAISLLADGEVTAAAVHVGLAPRRKVAPRRIAPRHGPSSN